MICKIGICAGLFFGFFLLFYWMGKERIMRYFFSRTMQALDSSVRVRQKERRIGLPEPDRQKNRLSGLEKRLMYSGLSVRLPLLTPEVFIVCDILLCVGIYFLILLLTGSWVRGMLFIGLAQLVIYLALNLLTGRNYRKVNDSLMKFLDFLGNYSITAGEVSGVLFQISKYLEEPLKSVLEECYYEAQTTGDTSLALLSMAEKIEHPRFKELVRGMEVSIRYAADFTVLIQSSRKSVREYMSSRQERKAMVKEAFVNILILLGMSVLILAMVGKLTGSNMQEILLHTVWGRGALIVIGLILLLLYRQTKKLDK